MRCCPYGMRFPLAEDQPDGFDLSQSNYRTASLDCDPARGTRSLPVLASFGAIEDDSHDDKPATEVPNGV